MTETYVERLSRERKERLSRIASAMVIQPTKIDTKQEEEEKIVNRKDVDFKGIFKAVCAYYKVSMLDVISARRSIKIALARHVIAYIASQHTKLSTGMIASRLARDKSTIVYAIERMESLGKTDIISNDISNIKESLGL